jgi:hypothetical protein
MHVFKSFDHLKVFGERRQEFRMAHLFSTFKGYEEFFIVTVHHITYLIITRNFLEGFKL